VLQVLLAAGVTAVAVTFGLVLRRKRLVLPPTQPRLDVPAQLDRGDFPQATTTWLVAVFSSATCHSCADVVRKANVLQSSEVTVVEIEFGADAALHRKYDIQAVPMVAIADAQGVVQRGFAGPVTATDLWAAVAEARDPGSGPEPDLGR
jgi:hypothetical protein